jgi:redox-sensitive bicupin YhaK (pirin superfamily)
MVKGTMGGSVHGVVEPHGAQSMTVGTGMVHP